MKRKMLIHRKRKRGNLNTLNTRVSLIIDNKALEVKSEKQHSKIDTSQEVEPHKLKDFFKDYQALTIFFITAVMAFLVVFLELVKQYYEIGRATYWRINLSHINFYGNGYGKLSIAGFFFSAIMLLLFVGVKFKFNEEKEIDFENWREFILAFTLIIPSGGLMWLPYIPLNPDWVKEYSLFICSFLAAHLLVCIRWYSHLENDAHIKKETTNCLLTLLLIAFLLLLMIYLDYKNLNLDFLTLITYVFIAFVVVCSTMSLRLFYKLIKEMLPEFSSEMDYILVKKNRRPSLILTIFFMILLLVCSFKMGFCLTDVLRTHSVTQVSIDSQPTKDYIVLYTGEDFYIISPYEIIWPYEENRNKTAKVYYKEQMYVTKDKVLIREEDFTVEKSEREIIKQNR